MHCNDIFIILNNDKQNFISATNCSLKINKTPNPSDWLLESVCRSNPLQFSTKISTASGWKLLKKTVTLRNSQPIAVNRLQQIICEQTCCQCQHVKLTLIIFLLQTSAPPNLKRCWKGRVGSQKYPSTGNLVLTQKPEASSWIFYFWKVSFSSNRLQVQIVEFNDNDRGGKEEGVLTTQGTCCCIIT